MRNPVQDNSQIISYYRSRAIHGGMWDHGFYFLNVQERYAGPPTARRFGGLGFRIARNAQ